MIVAPPSSAAAIQVSCTWTTTTPVARKALKILKNG